MIQECEAADSGRHAAEHQPALQVQAQRRRDEIFRILKDCISKGGDGPGRVPLRTGLLPFLPSRLLPLLGMARRLTFTSTWRSASRNLPLLG